MVLETFSEPMQSSVIVRMNGVNTIITQRNTMARVRRPGARSSQAFRRLCQRNGEASRVALRPLRELPDTFLTSRIVGATEFQHQVAGAPCIPAPDGTGLHGRRRYGCRRSIAGAADPGHLRRTPEVAALCGKRPSEGRPTMGVPLAGQILSGIVQPAVTLRCSSTE
jgi:hypothetical protein